MKKVVWALLLPLFWVSTSQAQRIDFIEYDLPNQLHVILHPDKTAPVVAVSVAYHVGSKNEDLEYTGFAHFFEHLLFEGTDNIPRGKWDKYVASRGGRGNAFTTQDQTYYYEVFPAHEFKMGLWLESERMLHPVINEIGVATQREVVKEERRSRMDNQPYGRLFETVFAGLFKTHPYKWTPIGSMEHLNKATLSQFKEFFEKHYMPNNAVLTIAGDIDIEQTKKMVAAYFADIPSKPLPSKPLPRKQLPDYDKKGEALITQTRIDTFYDAHIQLPAIVTAYRTPSTFDKKNYKDAYALDLISYLLARGKSARLTKKMVDEQKSAVHVGAFNHTLEDYSVYFTYAIPNGSISLDSLLKAMDAEIALVQNTLISGEDFQKLKNSVEKDLLSASSSVAGIAQNLSQNYLFRRQTDWVNQELAVYQSITKKDMQRAAGKYLKNNQRLVLYYLPASK